MSDIPCHLLTKSQGSTSTNSYSHHVQRKIWRNTPVPTQFEVPKRAEMLAQPKFDWEVEFPPCISGSTVKTMRLKQVDWGTRVVQFQAYMNWKSNVSAPIFIYPILYHLSTIRCIDFFQLLKSGNKLHTNLCEPCSRRNNARGVELFLRCSECPPGAWCRLVEQRCKPIHACAAMHETEMKSWRRDQRRPVSLDDRVY